MINGYSRVEKMGGVKIGSLLIGAALCFALGIFASTLLRGLPRRVSVKTDQTKKVHPPSKIIFFEITGQDTVWTVLPPLKELFADDDVRALVLCVGGEQPSYATAQAIASSIIQLKAFFPKPVFAYGEGMFTGSNYLLACAADFIMVSPVTHVGGIGVQWNLKRIDKKNQQEGIGYHFMSKGRYKGLARPELAMTDEYKKEAQALVDRTYAAVVSFILRKRRFLPANSHLWAGGRLFNAQEALALHMIDRVGDKSDLCKTVFNMIKIPFEPDHVELILQKGIPLNTTANSASSKQDNGGAIIAILRAKELDNKQSWQYTKALVDLCARDDVKGVILALDGNGCTMSLGSALYHDIRACRKTYNKPIVAYIEQEALSATYLIAAAADYIIAPSAACVGSIGVVWDMFDYTKNSAKENITYAVFKAGHLSDWANTQVPFTDQKKEILQKAVDAYYEHFIGLVKQARPQLNPQADTLWNEAQWLTVQDAQPLGLVDQIGSPLEAFLYIQKKCTDKLYYDCCDLKNLRFILQDWNAAE